MPETIAELAAEDRRGSTESVALIAHRFVLAHPDEWEAWATLYVESEYRRLRRREAVTVESADATRGAPLTVRDEQRAYYEGNRRVRELQRAYSNGEISLDAAVSSLDVHARQYRDATGMGAPWVIREHIPVSVDGEPFTAAVAVHRSSWNRANETRFARERADALAAAERAVRDRREAAGLPRQSGGWEHDLRFFMERMAHPVVMDFGPALLDSTFDTGDGRSVTWREATAADHESRISMQMQNAAGDMRDAARHLAAIDRLRERGTLAEAA